MYLQHVKSPDIRGFRHWAKWQQVQNCEHQVYMHFHAMQLFYPHSISYSVYVAFHTFIKSFKESFKFKIHSFIVFILCKNIGIFSTSSSSFLGQDTSVQAFYLIRKMAAGVVMKGSPNSSFIFCDWCAFTRMPCLQDLDHFHLRRR